MKIESCKRLPGGKSETPEDTIARLEPIIWGMHEYRYIDQKVDEHLYWSALFVDELNFRSMGKGTSPLFSKAGALAEAAEWLTSTELGMLPGYVTGHQDDMTDPMEIEELISHVASVTPEIIKQIKDDEVGQHWVDGYSLIDNKKVKVPIEFVRRISGPSGLAAGNHKEEAMEHAMGEVFERRAHITVLRNKMVMPTIDIDTIDNPLIQEHIAFIRDQGIDVIIKDLSFGGELPCVGAYFLDHNIPEEFQFHHFFKVGASYDKEEALIRCFTEYTQGRNRDEFIKNDKAEQDRILCHDFRRIKCMEEDEDNYISAFMFGFVPNLKADYMWEGEVVPFDKGVRYDDYLDDINHSIELFKKLGRDCVIVDYTDPKIGFPVIEVISPAYSDVLPYHPKDSNVLFKHWNRDDGMSSYKRC